MGYGLLIVLFFRKSTTRSRARMPPITLYPQVPSRIGKVKNERLMAVELV